MTSISLQLNADTEVSTSDKVQFMQSENDSDFEADLAVSQRFNQQDLIGLIKAVNPSKKSSKVLTPD